MTDQHARTRQAQLKAEAAASEFAAEVRAFEPDPYAVVDGPGCSVRDLDAYEAAMDAALDEPDPDPEAEPELEAG